MHKWWARQLGSVFRAVSLYSLVNEPAAVNVCEPGQDEYDLSDFGGGDADSGDTTADLGQLIESVSPTQMPSGISIGRMFG
jgi:putative DNA methylase